MSATIDIGRSTVLAPTAARGAVRPADIGLAVIELADGAGSRRLADLPIVHIELVRDDPQTRFAQIKRSKRQHRVIKSFGTAVRDDLTPSVRWNSKEDARDARITLAEDLHHLGYTVFGFKTFWNTYVIELQDSVGPRVNPLYPWVYVGETSKPIDVRYREHAEGARRGRQRLFSPVVHKHHLQLRPDLYEHLPTRLSTTSSKAAERELADRLRRIGFSVKGGH